MRESTTTRGLGNCVVGSHVFFFSVVFGSWVFEVCHLLIPFSIPTLYTRVSGSLEFPKI